MDALDFRILASLDADARRSFADLARELNVSQPTIADRVRRLEDRGILKGSMLCLDHARLGYPVSAFVRIRTNDALKRGLVDTARKMPQIVELVCVTGEDCMIARVLARSVEDLANVIDRLTPFGSTSTSVVLGTYISQRNPISVQAESSLASREPAPRAAARAARVATRK